MSSKRAVQTPGEEPTQAPTENAGDIGSTETTEVLKDKNPAAEPTVADLLAIIKQQADQVAGLTAAVQNLNRAQSPAARVTEELPDIDSLDKAKIKTPVLTKQGWLVPETFGANPNLQR